MKYPKTPELKKSQKVSEDSQKIGAFLEWMAQEHPGQEPATINIQVILAEYFEIDLNRVEAERRSLLEYSRSKH